MTRHLIPVPPVEELLDAGLKGALAEALAADILAGKTVYNFDTEVMVQSEKASDDDRREAEESLKRLLLRLWGESK